MNTTSGESTKAASCFRVRKKAAISKDIKVCFRDFLLTHPVGGVGTGSEQPDSSPANRLTPPAVCETRAPNPQTEENHAAAVSFFCECVPPTATAQQRRHSPNGTTYQPAGVKRAAAFLRAVMERHAPVAPLTGPLRVRLLWTWPGKETAPKPTRPDLDNLAKLALDAMTAAGYWQDDSQVAELVTAKFTGPIPGVAVTVRRIEA